MSIFVALAEPNRRAILDLLLERERPVGAIVDALDIGQPTVSKHLKILRQAGVVSMRIDANKRIYGLRPEPFADLEDWLMPYRRRWSQRLDALERLLDETPIPTSIPNSHHDNNHDNHDDNGENHES